jgi:hypothetical protein
VDECKPLRAGRGGAGIYMVSRSSLLLKDSNVTDNEADEWGGGLCSWESNITIQARVLHSFPFPLNLSLLCPFPPNLSLPCPPYNPN